MKLYETGSAFKKFPQLEKNTNMVSNNNDMCNFDKKSYSFSAISQPPSTRAWPILSHLTISSGIPSERSKITSRRRMWRPARTLAMVIFILSLFHFMLLEYDLKEDYCFRWSRLPEPSLPHCISQWIEKECEDRPSEQIVHNDACEFESFSNAPIVFESLPIVYRAL